jgi:FAD/FMN-containing dehydrogenase
MCFVYDSEADRRRVMAPYLAAGLEGGERVGYLSHFAAADTLAWLDEAGVPAARTETRGSVEVLPAEHTYCPDGTFEPDTMLDALRALRAESDAAGHSGFRASGEMGWALAGLPGSERLLEYESKLNYLFPECQITGICQYDANSWDGGTILHVLRVHPYMVVRGQVLENPYYMRPDDYLREYDGRPPA